MVQAVLVCYLLGLLARSQQYHLIKRTAI
jgi:hypothetical protein